MARTHLFLYNCECKVECWFGLTFSLLLFSLDDSRELYGNEKLCSASESVGWLKVFNIVKASISKILGKRVNLSLRAHKIRIHRKWSNFFALWLDFLGNCARFQSSVFNLSKALFMVQIVKQGLSEQYETKKKVFSFR